MCICIDNEYDFISELTMLLVEDWKKIFRNESIEKFHIDNNNIDKKAEINQRIQKDIYEINCLLGLDNGFVAALCKRKWYTVYELEELGQNMEETKILWNKEMEIFKKYANISKSLIPEVQDDVWFYYKCIVSGNDEKLVKWFYEEVPSYGFLRPIQMIRLHNGNDIIKNFLLNTHSLC